MMTSHNSLLKLTLVLVLALTISACSSDSDTSSSSTQSTSATVASDYERDLYSLLPAGQQTCRGDRSEEGERVWPIAVAILNCETTDVTSLTYGLFSTAQDANDTYEQQATVFVTELEKIDQQVVANTGASAPCSTAPNESGEWGVQDGSGNGGRYTCLSEPEPRIVWTERTHKVIGEAVLEGGSVTDLIAWWTNKAGPK